MPERKDIRYAFTFTLSLLEHEYRYCGIVRSKYTYTRDRSIWKLEEHRYSRNERSVTVSATFTASSSRETLYEQWSEVSKAILDDQTDIDSMTVLINRIDESIKRESQIIGGTGFEPGPFEYGYAKNEVNAKIEIEVDKRKATVEHLVDYIDIKITGRVFLLQTLLHDAGLEREGFRVSPEWNGLLGTNDDDSIKTYIYCRFTNPQDDDNDFIIENVREHMRDMCKCVKYFPALLTCMLEAKSRLIESGIQEINRGSTILVFGRDEMSLIVDVKERFKNAGSV